MDGLLRTTTPIKYPGYEHSDSHSTGFFYRTNNDTYLVTARHCLFQSRRERKGPFKPKEIAIRLRDKSQHRGSHTERISLYDSNEKRRWIEPFHHEVDVAALPLNFSLRETGNTSFGTFRLGKSYDPKDDAVPGEPAIVAGYPVLNRETYSPILRNALISTALDVDFDAQPYFLVDSNLHEGTSGSPVLVREIDEEDRTHFKLIGIHSGRYDLSSEGGENLNRVWFLHHLHKRIIDFEPNLLDQ
jgi:V8-like Glu-specific endopeptidase